MGTNGLRGRDVALLLVAVDNLPPVINNEEVPLYGTARNAQCPIVMMVQEKI